MFSPIVIDRHEILEIVSTFPEGIRLSQLVENVGVRFGKSATFHTGSRLGMDLDALLASLESREKVRIVRGVVYPAGSPALVH
jgi:probable metal-binding protein